MDSAASRKKPNILISGTPGTGKTSLSTSVAETLGYRHVNVGDMIKEKGYHAGHNEEFDTYIFDEASEDRLLDDMEPLMAEGGVIVDFHTVDFFPERFFDLVIVLRTDNTVLYDRLAARGYNQKKIEENVTAEILQVVLEDAKENYSEEIVHELPSNTIEDLESAADRITTWVSQWISDHA